MQTNNDLFQSVVMLGATGAVGAETVRYLEEFTNLTKLTLLGKAIAANILREKMGIEILQWDDFMDFSEGVSGN